MKINISLSGFKDLILQYFDRDSLISALRQNDLSRETLIYISPENFVKLAAPGHDKEKEESVENALNAGEKIHSLPFFGVVTDKNGDVIVDRNGNDHEGRHRARALQKRGLTLIPVVLVSKESEYPAYRWGSTEKRPKYLIGYNNYTITFPLIQTYDTTGKYIGNNL